MTHFNCFVLDHFVVRNRRDVLTSQTFGPQVSTLHSVAGVKLAVGIKVARVIAVEREPMIITPPEVIGAYDDKGIKTQAEINPDTHRRPMPPEPHSRAVFHSPWQRRPTHTPSAFTPGDP
jgi:hypothetical protein